MLVVSIVLTGVLDLYDGVVARALGADSPKRRLTDSIVDRVNINGIFVGAVLFCGLPNSDYVPVLVRECVLVIGGTILLSLRSCTIETNSVHKIANVSLAIALGSSVMLGHIPGMMELAYAALLIGVLDYAGVALTVISCQKRQREDLHVYRPHIFEGIGILLEALRAIAPSRKATRDDSMDTANTGECGPD